MSVIPTVAMICYDEKTRGFVTTAHCFSMFDIFIECIFIVLVVILINTDFSRNITRWVE